MKKLHILLSIALCLIFLASGNIFAKGKVLGGKPSTHPDWFKESFLEIASDVEEAAEENKHVMLFMHLNGCPYCFKMVEENIKNAPYTDFIKDNFDVIALNIRGDREVALNDEVTVTEKELAARFKVNYTPTIVFLNQENKIVARTNGYRSVPDFKLVLDYVKEKAYQNTTLAKYLNTRKSQVYTFRDHPQITQQTNLQSVASKPLAVIFEDKGCVDCDAMHDKHLASPEVREILKKFTVTRLDALSEETIIDVDGNKTTPKAWTEKLGLTYRPAIVLFDKNREIIRIQSMLYSYQFMETLRYVGERHYEKYPESFYDYLGERSKQLTESGKDVYLSDE